MACGRGAALSHWSAAYLLNLTRGPGGKVHVSVAHRTGRHQPNIEVHRSSTLYPADFTTVGGIPCTNAARTLLDLADLATDRQLTACIEAAERRGLYDDRAVKKVIGVAGARAAARRLRSVLGAYEEPPATRTELERRALELFAQAGLPRPLVNTPVETAEAPFEVDFLWPDRALVVEADSYGWHSDRASFEEDRRRDQLMRAEGYSVVRITWRQVISDRQRIVRALVQIGSRT
jgi:Protein of unknown function (DUF559)